MPLILAGLLRLPFGTVLLHSSDLIGLLPRVNVTSLSLTLVVIVVLINAGKISVKVFIKPWHVVITKRIRFAVFVCIIQLIIPHVTIVTQFVIHNQTREKV